ncbi:hypothetical protein QTP88_009249 [Uroleucon formosanum]
MRNDSRYIKICGFRMTYVWSYVYYFGEQTTRVLFIAFHGGGGGSGGDDRPTDLSLPAATNLRGGGGVRRFLSVAVGPIIFHVRGTPTLTHRKNHVKNSTNLYVIPHKHPTHLRCMWYSNYIFGKFQIFPSPLLWGVKTNTTAEVVYFRCT